MGRYPSVQDRLKRLEQRVGISYFTEEEPEPEPETEPTSEGEDGEEV